MHQIIAFDYLISNIAFLFLTIIFDVQKQYIFVYRAIMEMAQFGDTEIESSEIKKTWMALTHEEKNKKCPKLEQEFAKLANIVDDRKALSVGKYNNIDLIPSKILKKI